MNSTRNAYPPPKTFDRYQSGSRPRHTEPAAFKSPKSAPRVVAPKIPASNNERRRMLHATLFRLSREVKTTVSRLSPVYVNAIAESEHYTPEARHLARKVRRLRVRAKV